MMGTAGRRCGGYGGLMLALVAVLLLCGCRTSPTSSRIRGSDFNETVNTMVESLLASDFLQERDPDSEPAYITINRVENLTTDIIPPAEQWMLMERVQSALPVSELAEHRNVHLLVPPERQTSAGRHVPASDLPNQTTHVLHAVFRSADRAGSTAARDARERRPDQRVDRYFFHYEIFELQSREIVWSELFEFAREASGLAIN